MIFHEFSYIENYAFAWLSASKILDLLNHSFNLVNTEPERSSSVK